jgi:excisionase family DNA binding protein
VPDAGTVGLAFLVFTAHTRAVTTTRADDELLTTGQAAAQLGCSRQHVVNLCEQGALPFVSVGTHRRVRRGDVCAIAGRDRAGSHVTRDQVRSLWLHRAVAGRLAQDPDAVLARARANVHRWLATRPEGGATRSLQEWAEILDAGPEAVMGVLVSPSPRARELRQNSPFTRVLSEAERQSIIRSFGRYWRGVAARGDVKPGPR